MMLHNITSIFQHNEAKVGLWINVEKIMEVGDKQIHFLNVEHKGSWICKMCSLSWQPHFKSWCGLWCVEVKQVADAVKDGLQVLDVTGTQDEVLLLTHSCTTCWHVILCCEFAFCNGFCFCNWCWRRQNYFHRMQLIVALWAVNMYYDTTTRSHLWCVVCVCM